MRIPIRVHPCHPWLLLLFLFPACAHRTASTSQPPSPSTASPALFSPTLRIEDWSFQGHPGSLITTPHYRLYSTCSDPDLVSRLPEFLERSLTVYTTSLGPLPAPTLRLDTFLLADRPQWETLTRQLMGDEAPTYLRIDRGGFSSGGRAVLLPLGPRDTFAIASHEGWHQYTQRTFKDPLPAWLDEGLATTFEGLTPDPADPTRFLFDPAANPERLAQLRRAFDSGSLLSLAQLCDTTPDALIAGDQNAALTWYAQVWALARLLRESPAYSPALHSILADAASGSLRTTLTARSTSPAADRALRARRGPEILLAYTRADLPTLDAALARYTRTLLAPNP